MDSKKLGVILIVGGIVLLGVSYYIKSRVAEGREQISSAESKVSTGKKLFSLTPYTAPVGDAISSSADRKIAAGKEEVALYEQRARLLKIAGIICALVGVGVFVLGRKRA